MNSVLRFWRDVEIFTIPRTPTSKDNRDDPPIKVQNLKYGAALPWELPQFRETETAYWSHSVYIGVESLEDLSKSIIGLVAKGSSLSEEEINGLQGNGWMAAFAVSGGGRPIPTSYIAASFVLGLECFLQGQSLDGLNSALRDETEDFANRLAVADLPGPNGAESEGAASIKAEEASSTLTWLNIEDETRYLLEKLNLSEDPRRYKTVIKSVQRSKKKNDIDDVDIDFINSFFLEDLDRLIHEAETGSSFGQGLATYLGPALPPEKHIDTLADRKSMAELVSPTRLPAGRWPGDADKPLALAQQSAVFTILHRLGDHAGILGVNGPPGTGKTTLLCDVIADIVIKRAEKISRLEEAADVFLPEKHVVGGREIWVLNPELVKQTGVVVASSNNAAVKNISEALPVKEKVGDAYQAESYLHSVAESVLRAQNPRTKPSRLPELWGFIAGVLGNMDNRRKFAQGFWWGQSETQDESSRPKNNEVLLDAEDETDDVDDVEEETNAEIDPRTLDVIETPTNASVRKSLGLNQLLDEYKGEYNAAYSEWEKSKNRFLDISAKVEKEKARLIVIEQTLKQAAIARHNLQIINTDIPKTEQRLSILVKTDRHSCDKTAA